MNAVAEITPRLRVRIAERKNLAGSIAHIVLERVDGQPFPAVSAGAHVDVFIGDGLVRQYSLCGQPSDMSRYTLGVLRDAQSRGGSAWMWEHALAGLELDIGVPRNLFPLQAFTGKAILLGGGIGITPVMSMAHLLADMGGDFVLHYACRSRTAGAFVDILQATPFAEKVVLHFDDEPDSKIDLVTVLQSPGSDNHVYVCGPTGFIAAVEASAAAAGWPASQVHKEYFTPQASTATGNTAFDVVLQSSGQVIHVPADRSIASVLLDHGVPILLSCEQGVCGTCSTLVVEGEPDHRDSYLTPEEKARNDTILICCSRSKRDRLVLDI